CKPYMIGDIPCLDGGISDPIPVDKALADGCDKVVLILTRPVDQPRQAKKDRLIADLLSRAYPRAGERMRIRYQTYNDGVARAQALQAQGKVLIVAPDDICGLSTLTKDRQKLKAMYEKGVHDAKSIGAFLKE
ncbi:MAG: DUF6363 domain-containing protein, partial [Aristaeellaceae bacterium]